MGFRYACLPSCFERLWGGGSLIKSWAEEMEVTYFHMWWEWELLLQCCKFVFKEMLKNVKVTSDVPFPPNLHYYQSLMKSKRDWSEKELIMNMVMTARLVIVKNWKLKYMFHLNE